MKKSAKLLLVIMCLSAVAACAPEVGSKEWCNQLEERQKSDWTSNEAINYTKHCLITSRDDE